jgi:hypothetical protein
LSEPGLSGLKDFQDNLGSGKGYTPDATMFPTGNKGYTLDATMFPTRNRGYTPDATMFPARNKGYTLDAIMFPTVTSTINKRRNSNED